MELVDCYLIELGRYLPEDQRADILAELADAITGEVEGCAEAAGRAPTLADERNVLRRLSYCQIWCMPMKSSGDLAGLFDLFSVNKFHAFNNLCQVFEAA